MELSNVKRFFFKAKEQGNDLLITFIDGNTRKLSTNRFVASSGVNTLVYNDKLLIDTDKIIMVEIV